MKNKADKWNSAKGILEELHRIREESHRERLRIGDAAWLRKINRMSKFSRALKAKRKTGARS